MNKKILLIITGSIAAYKALDLIRLLKKSSYEVTCVMTKAAQEFITPLLVESISQQKVYLELFSKEDELEMGHINLSRHNDLILVAPASADFIAKMVNGYADDLASSLILAANKKIMIAPAMNEKMWLNDSTQKNVKKLLEKGIQLIEPQQDVLACGEYGMGKMNSPEEIVKRIEDFFVNKDLLKGKKIVITGGATYEPIDPVRFIGNYSSGKQAILIANVLSEMGAEVKLIAANIKTDFLGLKKEQIITVKTAEEMLKTTNDNLKELDIFIACAAVADYKVKNIAKEKIKKSDSENLKLELVKNVDILQSVGNSKDRPRLVIGFAAESENLIEYAKTKLAKKNCDLVIANDVENGEIFNNSFTKAYLVEKTSVKELDKISKKELANILAKKIKDFLS